MIKKILFVLILIQQLAYAENKITILVSVNNETITNIDLLNEIEILKILNKNSSNIKNNYNIAVNNLINEIIKEQELKKNNIEFNEKTVNEQYKINIQNFEKNNFKLEEKFKNIIYKKIKIDNMWNSLILKKYSWKININMNEIEDKLNKFKDVKERTEEKEKLISFEKNKKLAIYSLNHLENLKNSYLIKFYK